MARNRLPERRAPFPPCPLDRAHRDAVLLERVCALGFADQRCGKVAVLVENHEALPLDGLDPFGLHIRSVRFPLVFEHFYLVDFERSSGVALDAADALAVRQVAAETLGQQLGADDLVVDLDHGNVSIIPAGRPGDWKKRYEFMPQGVWS